MLAYPVGVLAAVGAVGGIVRGAARALGVHRNQLRRWLTHHGVESKSVDTEVDDTVTDEA